MKKIKIYQFKHLFLLVLLSLAAQAVVAQGWTQVFYHGTFGGAYEADGVYISAMPGFSGPTQLSLFNVSSGEAEFGPFWSSHKPLASTSGSIPGSQPFHRFSRSATWKAADSLAVLVEAEPNTGGNRHLELILFHAGYDISTNDNFFDTVWIKDVYVAPDFNVYATEVILADDGNYLALAERESTLTPGDRDLLLVKISPEGNVLWSSVFGTADYEKGLALEQMADGRTLILMNRTGGLSIQPWLIEMGTDGSVLAETNLSASVTDEATGLTPTADGNLVVCGLNHAVGEDVFLLKIDPDGNQLWRQDYAFPDQIVTLNALIEDPAGDVVLAGKHENELTSDVGAFIMKVGATGGPNWERILRPDARDKGFTHLILYPNGGYVLGGWLTQTDKPFGYLVQTDVNGIVKPGQIHGNVFHDLDEDCLETAGDFPLENWIVEAYQSDTTVFYSDVDSLGNYIIECDTGDYTVKVIIPVGYWEPCVVDTFIHLAYLDTVQLDFPVQTEIECPYLTVEHNYFWANPCESTLFFVEYCNLGPVLAEDAYVEVTLDSVFTFEASQIPPSNINGQTLTFQLGNIAPNECHRFEFTAFTDCDAQLGFVACSEAHIYPDSLCFPLSPNWSGAIIETDGFCDGDSVRFVLTNVGTEPMAEMLEYIVIEDAVLLMPGNYELGPGESMDVAVEANGSTYHLIAQQVPGAPALSQPVSAVEGCIGSSGNAPSMGFFNQFPQNDGDGFISSVCWPLADFCGLNLISPMPSGFGNENYVFENTELEYRLLFRNTGSEDVFRVVLVDTLSPFLDPTTVRPGASSHPYEFDIDGEGVLHFTFSNINLPPEALDGVRSNGFVNFRVAQKPGNEVGTVIENSASIYFDFNLPVTTNKTWHTVHEPWIDIINGVSDVPPGFGELLAYPNPSAGDVIFELPTDAPAKAVFSIHDAFGRALRSDDFDGKQYRFQRAGLADGIYFYRVEVEGMGAYSGKLILK